MRLFSSAVPLCFLGAASGMAAPNSGQVRSNEKPNVILVITDDQGYGDLSCHGNPVLKTPALDQFHGISVRLTDYHVAPMSAPTRGQLITGLDAARNGAVNVSSGRSLLRVDIPTMADIFSANGYNTGIFGKWHLGDNYPFRPEDRGFKETVWFPSSHIGSIPDFWGNNYIDDTFIHNGRREEFKGYCTDVFFGEAMDFMSESASSGLPFFVYLATNTPHSPFIAPPEDREIVRELMASSKYSDLEPAIKARITSYLAMIRNIDSNFGLLVGFLIKNGLYKNTILIFTTDNGSTQGPDYYNANMRGRKAELYEGGHRVPLFISWPEGITDTPRDVDGLTQAQDILPTLIDLCNLKKPKLTDFDGTSLANVLLAKKEVDKERMIVINYSRMPMGFEYPSPAGPSLMQPERAAVLWKRWRLIGDQELYDLNSDPLQQVNVINKFPEVRDKMHAYLYAWWDDVKDLANEPQRIVIGNDSENPIMLTACEWMDVFVDQQAQVRRGVSKNSYWNLLVDKAGEYDIELRRWPRETGLPLTGNAAGGTAIPVSSARLLITGAVEREIEKPMAFEGLQKKVQSEDEAVVFRVNLLKGPISLHTWFDDEDSNTLCGAYYVYINRL